MAKKGSGTPKPKVAEAYRDLADAVNRNGGIEFPGPRFLVYEPDLGRRCILEEFAPRTVTKVPKTRVSNLLIKLTAEKLAWNNKFTITEKQCRDAVDYWMAWTAPIASEIVPIAFAGELTYAWDRLPWARGEGGFECPYFMNIIKRTTNADALMAWLGSLFFTESDRQGYVWLYGEGGEGKGSIVRLFSKLFNNTHATLEPTESTNQFWTSQLIGKRFCTINECENIKFITSGKFKSITGGDKIKAEFKGENHFSFYPICKIIITSNTRPAITSKASDTRRLIYCSIEPMPDNTERIPEKEFDELLWAERAAIVNTCIRKYQELCPDHRAIPTGSDDSRDVLASITESRFQDVFERFFESGRRPDPLKPQEWEKVTAAEVYSVLKAEYFNDFDVHRFYEFLERRYQVQYMKMGSGRLRYLVGMKFQKNITRMIIKETAKEPGMNGV